MKNEQIKIQIKNAGKRPACKDCTDKVCQTAKGTCSRGYIEQINLTNQQFIKEILTYAKTCAEKTQKDFAHHFLWYGNTNPDLRYVMYKQSQFLFLRGYLYTAKGKITMSTTAKEYLAAAEVHI